jgi:transketolase
MRNKFSEIIYKFTKKNKNIFVISADISPSGKMAELINKKNFINVGVAEQSMISMCAGLAMSGAKPFAYTIAPFALYRPFEMVRNDVCYQNLPVTIVGMGAGTTYASLGGTHTAIEDISIARSIPNLSILAPCDPLELEECVKYCCTKNKKPIYLRIGKSGENILSKNAPEKWKFGKIRKIREGSSICIITYGPITNLAFEITDYFDKKYKFSIFSSHTLKPFDFKTVKSIMKNYQMIISIEDHIETGGITSILKSCAYENKYKGKMVNFHLKEKFIKCYGSQKDLQEKHGISKNIIIKKINNLI